MGGALVAAVNTLSISESNEGSRNMLVRLLPALREVAPEIRLLLVCSPANRRLFDVDAEVVEVSLEHRRVLRRIVREQWTVPRLVRDRADVLVEPGGVGSLLARTPQVSIVQHQFALPSNRDAAGPDGPSRSRHLYLGWPLKLAMRRSAVVLAVSEYLARGLVDELGADPSKVRAMPLGVVSPPQAPVVGDREPLLLFVGTLFAYKDVATAIEGFARARARARLPEGSRFVVVGKDPDGTQVDRLQGLARAAGVGDAVQLAGPVDDAALEHLYRRAAALVMPSRFEGFGLPVLEAMRRGVPVVVAGSTSLPEVAGDGGLVATVGDPDAFGDAIARLLGDEPLRVRLGEAALARATEMTWGRTATILRDAIVAAAAGSRRRGAVS